jgi:hypothetical protein
MKPTVQQRMHQDSNRPMPKTIRLPDRAPILRRIKPPPPDPFAAGSKTAGGGMSLFITAGMMMVFRGIITFRPCKTRATSSTVRRTAMVGTAPAGSSDQSDRAGSQPARSPLSALCPIALICVVRSICKIWHRAHNPATATKIQTDPLRVNCSGRVCAPNHVASR